MTGSSCRRITARTSRYWKPFDESGAFVLGGFMMALVDTMQRWRDEVLFPYPAYCGRIA